MAPGDALQPVVDPPGDPKTSSAGFLLGGRIRYTQPRHGYRTGIEPVILAASIPARDGERVIEAGTGAGAALLCLAARLPGTAVVGIEQDAAMAAFARHNIAANGFAHRCHIIAGDIAHDLPDGPFDHACANPPWHASAGTPSPDPGRARAKRRPAGLLGMWAASLSSRLRPRGTLTLIVPAALLSLALAALADAGCGAVGVLPLWPKPGMAARLILIQAIRGAKGPDRILSGLVLHGPDGTYTPAADALLRESAPINLSTPRSR